MKNENRILTGGLVLLLVCGAAGMIIAKYRAHQAWQKTLAATPVPARTPPETRPEPVREAMPPAPAPQVEAPTTPPPAAAPPPVMAAAPPAKPQKNSGAPGQGGGKVKEPLQDPLAREALAYVGADPAAEAYWYDAINNPDLPANERKDLIEDLNEEGFSDGKHATVDDLPLIITRLQMIEAAAPHSLDDVNAAAFAEAYKDLWNMYARLTQQGK